VTHSVDLAAATAPAWPPKIRWLARLLEAGIAVPGARVVRLAQLDPQSAPTPPPPGPWIVRSALVGEDAANASAAGLGRSVGDCTDAAAVYEALQRVDAGRLEPWLLRYRGPAHPHDAAIVQQQIEGPWLVVAALPTEGGPFIECHRPGPDALAGGTTPQFAGEPTDWDDPTAPALLRVLQRVREFVGLDEPGFEHGLDVEAVCDDSGTWWLVQLRPLSGPLHPGWSSFAGQVQAEGDRIPPGLLTLDAEHNPAPLSEAHASLMRWLAQQRPGSGRPTILAGWLYVHTLVRDLPQHDASRPGLSVDEALQQLRDRFLPQARARLQSVESKVRDAALPELVDALDDAQGAFLAMIDVYLGILVPTRRAAAELGRTARPDAPLTLDDRAPYRDVLPAAWDIASPTLAELSNATGSPSATASPRALPDDPAEAMTLLTEWDDNLFAVGLAPLRRVYLRAGELLGLGDAVFWLSTAELRALAGGEASLPNIPTDTRRRRHQQRMSLRPPLRIHDGRPVPRHPRADLRGFPIGADFEGSITRREDLEHLIREPPQSDQIVVMPALTAPAAVALAEAEVRAVCCEYGGTLSHAALMARELGLSALIGCRGCTEIAEGTAARIDTTMGRLLPL